MSKVKKIMISFLSCFLLFVSLSIPLYSQEVPKSDTESEIGARWWPGDPNPTPGSEAWLQLHGHTAPKDSKLARKCAVEALGGSFNLSSISSWIAGGTWTVLNFSRSFGIGWTVAYFECVIKNI